MTYVRIMYFLLLDYNYSRIIHALMSYHLNAEAVKGGIITFQFPLRDQ